MTYYLRWDSEAHIQYTLYFPMGPRERSFEWQRVKQRNLSWCVTCQWQSTSGLHSYYTHPQTLFFLGRKVINYSSTNSEILWFQMQQQAVWNGIQAYCILYCKIYMWSNSWYVKLNISNTGSSLYYNVITFESALHCGIPSEVKFRQI